VADSQEARWTRTCESLRNLEEDLIEHGFDLQTIPYVLQLNSATCRRPFRPTSSTGFPELQGEPTFEATAPVGVGVFDTLKAVAKQVLMELRRSSRTAAGFHAGDIISAVTRLVPGS